MGEEESLISQLPTVTVVFAVRPLALPIIHSLAPPPTHATANPPLLYCEDVCFAVRPITLFIIRAASSHARTSRQHSSSTQCDCEDVFFAVQPLAWSLFARRSLFAWPYQTKHMLQLHTHKPSTPLYYSLRNDLIFLYGRTTFFSFSCGRGNDIPLVSLFQSIQNISIQPRRSTN